MSICGCISERKSAVSLRGVYKLGRILQHTSEIM